MARTKYCSIFIKQAMHRYKVQINSFSCFRPDIDQITKIFQVLGTPSEETWCLYDKTCFLLTDVMS